MEITAFSGILALEAIAVKDGIRAADHFSTWLTQAELDALLEPSINDLEIRRRVFCLFERWFSPKLPKTRRLRSSYAEIRLMRTKHQDTHDPRFVLNEPSSSRGFIEAIIRAVLTLRTNSREPRQPDLSERSPEHPLWKLPNVTRQQCAAMIDRTPRTVSTYLKDGTLKPAGHGVSVASIKDYCGLPL